MAESLFVRGHCSTTGSESETVLYDDTSKADKHGGRSGMAAGDPYRAKALELLAQAEVAKDADTRGNFESRCFFAACQQVERNEGVVIDFVLPPQDSRCTPRSASNWANAGSVP